jgi:cupin fold WbuC family metalloprotein
MKRDTSGKTVAFTHNEDVFTLDKYDLFDLKDEAEKEGKARILLHKDRKEKVQEMIIAMKRGYSVPLHSHNKTESYHVIEGVMEVETQKDNVFSKTMLGDFDSGLPFVIRLQPNIPHCNRAITPIVVFYEVLEGPFI